MARKPASEARSESGKWLRNVRRRSSAAAASVSAETCSQATSQVRALFRIGFLTEAVIEAQAKNPRLMCRLAQIEVAGVAVDNRVLVGEVGDIELAEPVTPVRIHPRRKFMML